MKHCNDGLPLMGTSVLCTKGPSNINTKQTVYNPQNESKLAFFWEVLMVVSR